MATKKEFTIEELEQQYKLVEEKREALKQQIEQKKKEEKLKKAEAKAPQVNPQYVKPVVSFADEKTTEKEAQKLVKRQAKAIKKAEKNDIKMQKQYAKVLKEASKKK
jgi:hypothetical protein